MRPARYVPGIAFVGFLFAAPAGAVCPESWIEFPGWVARTYSTDPVRDVSASFPGGPYGPPYLGLNASYDLPSGTAAAGVSAGGNEGQRGESSFELQDTFTLAGGGPGSIAFTMRLRLRPFVSRSCNPYVCGDGAFHVTLTSGASSAQFIRYTSTGGDDTTLTLVIERLAGEAFPVVIDGSTLAAYARASLRLDWTFDLPPGVTVTSCQGFGTAVPARRTTWGQLKSLYR